MRHGHYHAARGEPIEQFHAADAELLFIEIANLQKSPKIRCIQQISDALDLKPTLVGIVLIEGLEHLVGLIHLHNDVANSGMNRNGSAAC